jgi:anti-sigma B factor antagonist
MTSTDGSRLSLEVLLGPVSVVRARGDLDVTTAARLCSATDMAAVRAVGAPRVLIDLTRVTVCDATGLRALVGAVREVEVLGGTAVVAMVPGGVPANLLERSGLRDFVPVAASVEFALARLGATPANQSIDRAPPA